MPFLAVSSLSVQVCKECSKKESEACALHPRTFHEKNAGEALVEGGAKAAPNRWIGAVKSLEYLVRSCFGHLS